MDIATSNTGPMVTSVSGYINRKNAAHSGKLTVEMPNYLGLQPKSRTT